MDQEHSGDTPLEVLSDPMNHCYQKISGLPIDCVDSTYGSSHVLITTGFCHRCADAYFTANCETPLIGAGHCAMPIEVIT